MTPLPNPFESFNSAMSSQGADTVAAGHAPSPVAATVLIPESAASLPALVERTDVAATLDSLTDSSVAAKPFGTQYIPDPFSVYAHRRSMPIISPPLNAERIGLSAVRAALNIHPRDLDNDPPPLFLRKPSPAFLQTLFQLAGVTR